MVSISSYCSTKLRVTEIQKLVLTHFAGCAIARIHDILIHFMYTNLRDNFFKANDFYLIGN